MIQCCLIKHDLENVWDLKQEANEIHCPQFKIYFNPRVEKEKMQLSYFVLEKLPVSELEDYALKASAIRESLLERADAFEIDFLRTNDADPSYLEKLDKRLNILK